MAPSQIVQAPQGMESAERRITAATIDECNLRAKGIERTHAMIGPVP